MRWTAVEAAGTDASPPFNCCERHPLARQDVSATAADAINEVCAAHWHRSEFRFELSSEPRYGVSQDDAPLAARLMEGSIVSCLIQIGGQFPDRML